MQAKDFKAYIGEVTLRFSFAATSEADVDTFHFDLAEQLAYQFNNADAIVLDADQHIVCLLDAEPSESSMRPCRMRKVLRDAVREHLEDV